MSAALTPSRRFYVEGLGWPVHRKVPGGEVDRVLRQAEAAGGKVTL